MKITIKINPYQYSDIYFKMHTLVVFTNLIVHVLLNQVEEAKLNAIAPTYFKFIGFHDTQYAGV